MAAIIDFKATKCRHCYKCVRNCEVKAIMVKDGRAEIHAGKLCFVRPVPADLPPVSQDSDKRFRQGEKLHSKRREGSGILSSRLHGIVEIPYHWPGSGGSFKTGIF